MILFIKNVTTFAQDSITLTPNFNAKPERNDNEYKQHRSYKLLILKYWCKSNNKNTRRVEGICKITNIPFD